MGSFDSLWGGLEGVGLEDPASEDPASEVFEESVAGLAKR